MRTTVVNRIVWSALPFAALLVAGCAGSKTEPATGTLTGKAIYANESDSSGIAVSLDGPVHQSALTAADGTYTFQTLPAGSYALLFTPTAAQERPQLRTASVSATPGSTVANVVFTAVGALSGTATFGSATGNAGILVVSPGSSAVAVTDDAGNFTLHGLPTGTVDVIASAPGFASASDHAVAVVHNTTQPAPALTLQAGSAGIGSITGQVILAGMSAQAGIPVTLQGINSSAAALTDATGAITFTGLPDGQYALTAIVHDALRVSETLAVQVLGGQQLSSPQFHFTPTGLVSGVATLQGATAGNAGITATAIGAPSVTVTNDSGAYLLQGVPVGSFDIVASYPDRQSAVTSAPVQVAWGQTTVAPALTLGPPLDAIGQVQGTVTLTGLSDAHGVIVTLSGATPAVSITDASGTFVFKNLVAGNYTLTASAPSTAESLATIGFTISADAPFVAGANFTFTPVGSAQGKVANQNGAAVAGALVVAQGTARSTLSDTSGNFLLSGIPAGPDAVLSASIVGSESAPVTVAIAYSPQTPSIADAGTLTLSNVVQANVTIAGQFSLYGGLFGTTPDPTALTVSWSGAATGSTKVDGSGAWSAVTPVGFYTLSVGEDDALRSATIPNTLAMSGGDGFVVQEQLYPLDTPLELEYGKQVVSGENVSAFVTNSLYSGDALFTVSGGAVAAGQPRQADGTLAIYHDHRVTLVPGAVPDLAPVGTAYSDLKVATATIPQAMQLGPMHSAVYLENGIAFLALVDGSIHDLGILVAQDDEGADAGPQPLQLGANVAVGGNVIAIIGMNQGEGACSEDPINGNALYPVYAVNVGAPDTVKLVGCANSVNDGVGSLIVSPDGRGVWIEWTGSGNNAVDTVVQSSCDLNVPNSGCPIANLSDSYDLNGGVYPTFSSDGSAAIMQTNNGLVLATSDGTTLSQLSSGGTNDGFNVYPAVLTGTASDVLELDISGQVQYDCGQENPCSTTATTSVYLEPFVTGLNLLDPTLSSTTYPGIVTLNSPIANYTNKLVNTGVAFSDHMEWSLASHLVFMLGNGAAYGGTLQAVSFTDAVTGNASPTTVSTSAQFDQQDSSPTSVVLQHINGKDYLIYNDEPDGKTSTLESYDFTAQSTQALATGVDSVIGMTSYANQVVGPRADWIAWSDATSENCYATQFDVAGGTVVNLGLCDAGQSITFSPGGAVAAVYYSEVLSLVPLNTATPTAVPITLKGYAGVNPRGFLTDDTFVVQAKVSPSLSAFVTVGLDAAATNGLAVRTVSNPNFDAVGQVAAVVAPNGNGLIAQGRNNNDGQDSGYIAYDYQTLAAGASGATDLGVSFHSGQALRGKAVHARAAAKELGGAESLVSAAFFATVGYLADGSALSVLRVSEQDVTTPDTGVGSLVVASTSGWAAHMLSHASSHFVIIPGTMEILGAQQRTAAPWSAMDGVYALSSPTPLTRAVPRARR